MKIRLLNFMAVGSLGALVSFAIYIPLTLLFKAHISFLGQEFYLPATIPSTLGSITFNYYMNRRFTFGDCKAKSMSLLRYETTASATAVFDIALLFLMVHYLHIYYLLAAVFAVLMMFLYPCEFRHCRLILSKICHVI